jgi:hypothetical protein
VLIRHALTVLNVIRQLLQSSLPSCPEKRLLTLLNDVSGLQLGQTLGSPEVKTLYRPERLLPKLPQKVPIHVPSLRLVARVEFDNLESSRELLCYI